MWSLSLSSSFFATFFHPSLYLSLCIYRVTTNNLSPRVRIGKRERETRGFGSNFQTSLSLSLSLVDATILINTLHSLCFFFIASSSSSSSRFIEQTEPPFFPRRGGKSLPPRAFSSPKFQSRKIRKTKRAIDRTHLFLKERAQTKKREEVSRTRVAAAAITTTTFSLSLLARIRIVLFCEHLSLSLLSALTFCFLGF
jgi:hypothetical protein